MLLKMNDIYPSHGFPQSRVDFSVSRDMLLLFMSKMVEVADATHY